MYVVHKNFINIIIMISIFKDIQMDISTKYLIILLSLFIICGNISITNVVKYEYLKKLIS